MATQFRVSARASLAARSGFPLPMCVGSGHVQLLLSQDVYGFGYKGVEHLVNKLRLKKDPANPIDNTPLTAVTKTNVEEFAKNWEKWLPK